MRLTPILSGVSTLDGLRVLNSFSEGLVKLEGVEECFEMFQSDHLHPIVEQRQIGYGYNIVMKSQVLDEIIHLVEKLYEELDKNKELFRDYLTKNDLDQNCVRWSAGIIFLRNGCCGNKLPRRVHGCTECFRKHYLNCLEKNKKRKLSD